MWTRAIPILALVFAASCRGGDSGEPVAGTSKVVEGQPDPIAGPSTNEPLEVPAVRDTDTAQHPTRIPKEVSLDYEDEQAAAEREAALATEDGASEPLTAAEARKISRDYPAPSEPERVIGEQVIELPNQARLVVVAEEPIVIKAKVCVSDQGEPTKVEIVDSSGFPKLDAEAKKQMGQWTFEPREVEGEPVAFCEIVNFELQG